MFQDNEFPVMEVSKHRLDDHLFGILLGGWYLYLIVSIAFSCCQVL